MGLSEQLFAELSPIATTFPDLLPQEPTLPALVFSIVAHEPAHNHDGADELMTERVQIDVWAETRAERDQIDREVRLALDGRLWGNPPVSSFLESRFTVRDSDTGLWRSIVDFRVQFTDEEES